MLKETKYVSGNTHTESYPIKKLESLVVYELKERWNAQQKSFTFSSGFRVISNGLRSGGNSANSTQLTIK
jgi:hypothetical protein